MTVAMSRARLGLYVLGRREVFEACPELRPAFDVLLERPDKLTLVTGEMWPAQRASSDNNDPVEGEVVMEGVEHLGQYVFEMTNTKVQQLQSEGGSAPALEAVAEEDMQEDGYEEEGKEEEEEDDDEEEDGLEPDIQEVREGEAN